MTERVLGSFWEASEHSGTQAESCMVWQQERREGFIVSRGWIQSIVPSATGNKPVDWENWSQVGDTWWWCGMVVFPLMNNDSLVVSVFGGRGGVVQQGIFGP